MPAKFKVIAKGKPGDPDAPKKYYASPVYNGKKSVKQIGKDIADISSLSYGDITNVLSNLILQIPKYLADGNIVSLGELGSLRLGISSEGAENEKDFNAGMIKSAKIIFTPGTEVKEAISKLKFERMR